MLVHCNLKFRPEEIQFLYDNDMFTNRRLEIGVCPVCDKLIARLVEERITDGKVFDSTLSKYRAEQAINDCKTDIQYSSLDLPKGKGSLYGYRYGENKEHYNKKTGVTTVIQKSCDFYGNKEEVKRYTNKP